MIDPPLIEAMSHAQAFRAIAIVRDIRDVTGAIEVARAVEIKNLEREERATAEWLKVGSDLRRRLWDRCRGSEDLGSLLPVLTDAVVLADRAADESGKALNRSAKALRRLARESFRVSPQHGAVARELTERLIALLERRYEEKLDFAAFIRALRAEHDPEARDGPVFPSVDELDAYLRAAAT